MAGKHPKEEGNCLFISEQMRQAQMQRDIAQQTNNHLVRHRLLILRGCTPTSSRNTPAATKARIGPHHHRSESGPAGNVRHDGQAEGAGPGLRLANFKRRFQENWRKP